MGTITLSQGLENPVPSSLWLWLSSGASERRGVLEAATPAGDDAWRRRLRWEFDTCRRMTAAFNELVMGRHATGAEERGPSAPSRGRPIDELGLAFYARYLRQQRGYWSWLGRNQEEHKPRRPRSDSPSSSPTAI